MAGSKSDYLELEVLDHFLGGYTEGMEYTPPEHLYVALFTTAPTDSGGGTEVSGGSYARVEIDNTSTTWPAAGSGHKHNGIDITFPTATGDWGEVKAFALFDDDETGNMLYWGDLTTSKTINTGDTAKFAAGDITISED